MSHIRTALREAGNAVLLVVIFAAVGALASVLSHAQDHDLTPPANAATFVAAEPAARSTVDPLLTALAPGSDLAPDTAAALLAAADRVCEGVTAEVPVVDMANALTVELSLTDEEARTFVNTAATVHCANLTL